MGVICSESGDQDIDVRGHSSTASKRDRLLVPSTPLRKPPCLADRGKSFNVPFDGALCLRSLSANPSSIILVSVVRSFAASAFALATRSSRRSRVVFMAPRVQKSVCRFKASAATIVSPSLGSPTSPGAEYRPDKAPCSSLGLPAPVQSKAKRGGGAGSWERPRSPKSWPPPRLPPKTLPPSPRSGPCRPLRAADPLPRPRVDRSKRGKPGSGELAGAALRGASQPNGRAGGARDGGGRAA